MLLWMMRLIGRKPGPVPAVDERLLKQLLEDMRGLTWAEFDFCVDCLTESADWRAALFRLHRERRQVAAELLSRAANQ